MFSKKKIVLTALLFIGLAGAIIFLFNESINAVIDINQAAINYLKTKPQTAWSTMALAGAGEPAIDLNHLKSVPSAEVSATAYAKYILALASVGENPTSFGNENYVEKLRGYYRNNQFGDEQYLNDDIWSILALGSVGKEYLPEVQEAKQFVLNNQNSDDGGWSFGLKGNSSSADMTASAIMALIEAGVSPVSPEIINGVNYLKSVQNNDGGFPGWTGESSASSDAWVISAIYKLGQDPTNSNWTKNGNPIEHLKSLQDPEKGFFYDTEGGAGEDSFVTTRTAFAPIALSGKTYPLSTSYNLHSLRIEGFNETIYVGETNGGTVLDLVIEGAKSDTFSYSLQYYESFDSFLLTKINNEENWEYRVNNILPMVGADNYYLNSGDEVLWYGVNTLWGTWLPTKVELTKTGDLVKIQVKYYDSATNDWQNLELEGIKTKVGLTELTTNNLGKVEISLSGLETGFYQVFAESQIINETGYIRSKKVNLTAGGAPEEHQVGLKVVYS